MWASRRRDPRVRDEIQFHRDRLIEDYMSAGMSRADAERRAFLEFGNVAAIEARVKDVRGRWFEGFWKDARYALRTLRRERGFSAAVVLTLALGLGGCLAIFTVVDAVILRPLPFPSPNQLAILWMSNPQQGFDRDVIAYPQFRDWRDQSRGVFEAMAVHSGGFASVSGGGAAQEIRISQVSEEFFAVLGAEPALGRVFAADEFVAGRHRVVVLAHALWAARFGRDAGIVGRTISLDAEPFTVIGVLPEAVAFPATTEAWTPLALTPDLENRGALWLDTVARLRPDVAIGRAQSAMEVIAARLNQQYPDANPGSGAIVSPMHEDLVGSAAQSIWLLQGAVLLVLLIACANVSNLLLTRATARHREVATRIALGASLLRMARQCLTETLVLAGAGAVLGLSLAAWLVRVLPTVAPPQVPLLDGITVNISAMAAAAALALAAALLVGLAPLLHVRRLDINTAIKEGGRVAQESGGSGKLRLTLVMGQIALALVLLVGAGLLMKSFANVLGLESGFTTDSVLTARVALPAVRYPAQRRVATWNELTRQIGELPGVRSAGAVSTVLIGTLPNSAPLTGGGRGDLPAAIRALPVAIDSATPGYFEAVGQRVVAGRGFKDADAPDSFPVTIVNESFARTYFGSIDALGQRITFGAPGDPQATWLTIVGVVHDVRRGSAGPHLGSRPEIYRPYAQRQRTAMVLVVRADGDAMTLAGSIATLVRAIDPDVPLARVRSLQDLLGARLAERRFVMGLLGGFAALALLLSALGVYGVVAYTVARRLPEFGVCLALGAKPRNIALLVLRQGLIVSVVGTFFGTLGAIAVTRFAGPQLYEVSPRDPWVFLVVALLLLSVAALASWLPARRACRVDPMIVLRRE